MNKKAIIDELFAELVEEFNAVKTVILKDPRFWSNIRMGSYAERGKTRYSGGYLVEQGHFFSPHYLGQYLRLKVKDFSATRKIVALAIKDRWWPKVVEDFEHDMLKSPSITQNIVAGFLVRNFELNQYRFEITDHSFERAKQEFKNFVTKETIDITCVVNLHGPHGEVPKVSLANGVSVERADFETARLFGLAYSTTADGFYIDLHEGDYVLKIEYTIPKKDFMLMDQVEKLLIEKWYNVPLFALVGNIEKGKTIRISNDWPVVTLKTPHAFFYNLNRYSSHRKSAYEITADNIGRLTDAAAVIVDVKSETIDKRIRHAISRIKKAKSSFDLEDRIVELSLALEYLINTSPYEVSLQLRLKAAKLLGSKREVHIIQTVKKFYEYRSKVVHGSGEITNNTMTLNTVNDAERIILDLLLRMINLNQKFSFKEVSKALDDCLFLPESFEEILHKTSGG